MENACGNSILIAVIADTKLSDDFSSLVRASFSSFLAALDLLLGFIGEC